MGLLLFPFFSSFFLMKYEFGWVFLLIFERWIFYLWEISGVEYDDFSETGRNWDQGYTGVSRENSNRCSQMIS